MFHCRDCAFWIIGFTHCSPHIKMQKERFFIAIFMIITPFFSFDFLSRYLGIAILTWIPASCSPRRTVRVETVMVQWLMSSDISFTAVVWWLFVTINFKDRRSLSFNIGFRPLSLCADDVLPCFVSALVSVNTTAPDTFNNSEVLSTYPHNSRAPIICPLKIWQVAYVTHFPEDK